MGVAAKAAPAKTPHATASTALTIFLATRALIAQTRPQDNAPKSADRTLSRHAAFPKGMWEAPTESQ
jgi:hypothetical protein